MKIDKHVPLPPPDETDNRTKYAFRSMEVGDSFYIEGKEAGHRVRAAARNMTRRSRLVLTVRREGSGVRVWRVA